MRDRHLRLASLAWRLLTYRYGDLNRHANVQKKRHECYAPAKQMIAINQNGDQKRNTRRVCYEHCHAIDQPHATFRLPLTFATRRLGMSLRDYPTCCRPTKGTLNSCLSRLTYINKDQQTRASLRFRPHPSPIPIHHPPPHTHPHTAPTHNTESALPPWFAQLVLP